MIERIKLVGNTNDVNQWGFGTKRVYVCCVLAEALGLISTGTDTITRCKVYIHISEHLHDAEVQAFHNAFLDEDPKSADNVLGNLRARLLTAKPIE